MTKICVSYSHLALKKHAQQLADNLQLTCVAQQEATAFTFCLMLTTTALELHSLQQNFNPIVVNFLSGDYAYRRQYGGGIKQTIAKAIGIKSGYRPVVLDATAGLGRDAFVFAGLGCCVHMVERHSVLAALLNDGLQRFYLDKNASDDVNLTLTHANSIEYLQQLTAYPDVIYLDPMYPEKKKAADVKKAMQILRQLIGQNEDVESLFDIARQRANKRVVVKRPKTADYIKQLKPDIELMSKSHRYDIYLIK